MYREIDRRRYRSTAELLVAIRELHLLTQRELAERSGVARAQLARYEKGHVEPSVGTLRRLLEGLGWALTLGLEPTMAVLDEQLGRRFDLRALLDVPLLSAVELVALAAADGVDVVVGGEVAAVLQGVPVSTTHLVVYLRADHVARFRSAAAEKKHELVASYDDDRVWELWWTRAPYEVLLTDVLPPTRHVRMDSLPWLAHHLVPVVDLATLLTSESALSPSAIALAHRMGDPEASESIPRSVL